MTNAKSTSDQIQLIICDTNVVILMYLFKATKMFDASYSFGSVKIHPCVIDQIQEWLKRRNKKVAKFGEQLLKDVIAIASEFTEGIKEPTDIQLSRSRRILSNIENQLSSDEIGMATDEVDQYLLILAFVNKACLATQERTMSAVGRKSFAGSKVVRFEDLVIDLVKSGALSHDEAENGVSAVEYYNERLDSAKRAEILSLAKAKASAGKSDSEE